MLTTASMGLSIDFCWLLNEGSSSFDSTSMCRLVSRYKAWAAKSIKSYLHQSLLQQHVYQILQ